VWFSRRRGARLSIVPEMALLRAADQAPVAFLASVLFVLAPPRPGEGVSHVTQRDSADDGTERHFQGAAARLSRGEQPCQSVEVAMVHSDALAVAIR
jgi:hypothetical protein